MNAGAGRPRGGARPAAPCGRGRAGRRAGPPRRADLIGELRGRGPGGKGEGKGSPGHRAAPPPRRGGWWGGTRPASDCRVPHTGVPQRGSRNGGLQRFA